MHLLFSIFYINRQINVNITYLESVDFNISLYRC